MADNEKKEKEIIKFYYFSELGECGENAKKHKNIVKI